MKQRYTNSELSVITNRLRKHVIRMVQAAGSGHPGGSLSAADIIAALYFDFLNIDPKNPADPDRDRFVLSKGHAAPILYAALAERGFFPVDDLITLRRAGSYLQGHPDMKSTPGVEMSTGSLGQGLSTAVGMALAGKMDGRNYRVVALLGDGELQEGQIWEAAMAAAHYRLDNLIVIVDNNGLQIDGRIDEVMSPLPITDKFRSFGFETVSIDGHDIEQIRSSLRSVPLAAEQPTCLVARTIKGKGVSFMENQVGWHGKAPSAEQAAQALSELDEAGVDRG